MSLVHEFPVALGLFFTCFQAYHFNGRALALMALQ